MVTGDNVAIAKVLWASHNAPTEEVFCEGVSRERSFRKFAEKELQRSFK